MGAGHQVVYALRRSEFRLTFRLAIIMKVVFEGNMLHNVASTLSLSTSAIEFTNAFLQDPFFKLVAMLSVVAFPICIGLAVNRPMMPSLNVMTSNSYFTIPG